MSTIPWQNGVNGDWSTGSNWTGGTSPGAGDDALVDAAGTYTVTISSAVAAHSLTVNDAGATVEDAGGLTLGDALTMSAGTFQLAGSGTIAGGTLQATGGSFAWQGGTLDGVTYKGTLDLTPNNSAVTIVDGLTMVGATGTGPGTIDMTGGQTAQFGGVSGVLTFAGTQTLTNATIDIGTDFSSSPGYGPFANNGPPNVITVTGAAGTNAVLTLGAGVTINHTGAGNYSVLGDGAGTIVNDGTINATAPDPGFTAAPPAFPTPDSNFIYEDFAIMPSEFVNDGTIIVGDGDLLDIGGSTVELGAVPIPDPAGETFINNGTITVSGAGLQIDALNSANNGSITVNDGRLLIAGSLASIGTVSATDSFLILPGTTTVRLTSLFGNDGNTVSLQGALDNRGQTLGIGASDTFSHIVLQALTGASAIIGGTIRDSGGGLVSGGLGEGAGGTLDGVTYDGTLDLSPNMESSLTITNGFRMHGLNGTGTGTIDLGDSDSLTFLGTQTIDGATINAVADGLIGTIPEAIITSSGGTLTLGPHMVITEPSADVGLVTQGLVNDGSVLVQNVQSTDLINNGAITILGFLGQNGITASSLVNNGTITDIFGNTDLINATTLLNNGTITIENGSTDTIAAGLFTNNGTIGFEAGQLTIAAPLVGSGRISFGNGGTLTLAQSCAAGQTVLFEDDRTNLLRLDDPASFQGTIAGFGAGDTIDLAGVMATAASFSGNMIVVTLAGGGTIDLSVAGSYATTGFALASDGSGGTDLTVVPGQSFTLTAQADTVSGGTGPNTIVASAGTLSAGDQIDGGPATNTLVLQGGGTFNLRAPTTLSAIALIAAQEEEGGNRQAVYLRAGLNAIVAVASSMSDPGDIGASGITIYGAANSDVIDLGRGNDTIYLGAGETVNGGGGSNVFAVAASDLGTTTIHGGADPNILEITGGGGVALPGNDTGIDSVWLSAAPAGATQPDYDFTANGLQGLEIVDKSGGNDTITIGDASQIVRAGNGDMTIKAAASSAGALLLLGSGRNTLEITTGGTATLNALTADITVELDQATTLTLSGKSGVTAIGSSESDTIIAKAAGQTLTGNGGGDTLIGYAGGGDIFRDTTAGFAGATIEGFVAPSDTIDVTDLGFGPGTTLGYSQGSGEGVLTLSDGAHQASIALFGQFAAAGFHLASDGGAGTAITYTPPTPAETPMLAARS